MFRPAQEVPVSQPIQVVASSHDENPERMIRKFIRKVKNDGVIREYFLRQSFEKPSAKRRRRRTRSKD